MVGKEVALQAGLFYLVADGKKSFILYCDQVHLFENLNDKEAGRLIKHIFRYVTDQNPEAPDRITKISFEPIMRQLKRDLQDWEDERHKRSESGRKGGIKSGEARRSKPKQNEGVLQKPKQTEANEAVNGNVTVNVNDNVIERGYLSYDAEKEILKNPIEKERIFMAGNFSEEQGREILHKFHLYLESIDKYPQTKKQIFSGFERWVLNEKKFIKNGTYKQSSNHSTKTRGAYDLLEKARDIARRKTDT